MSNPSSPLQTVSMSTVADGRMGRARLQRTVPASLVALLQASASDVLADTPNVYLEYSMRSLAVPPRRTLVTLVLRTGNQKSPNFLYSWSISVRLIQIEGFLAGSAVMRETA